MSIVTGSEEAASPDRGHWIEQFRLEFFAAAGGAQQAENLFAVLVLRELGCLPWRSIARVCHLHKNSVQDRHARALRIAAELGYKLTT